MKSLTDSSAGLHIIMKSLSHIRGVLSSVKKLLLRRDDKFEGMV